MENENLIGIVSDKMSYAPIRPCKITFYPIAFYDEVWANCGVHTDLMYTYWVSNHGRIYSERLGAILNPGIEKNGYCRITLFTKDGREVRRSVHRLVMESFMWFDGCDEYEVNHKNGIKTCNELWNLEWVTAAENNRHALLNGLHKHGEDSMLAKYSNETVLKIADLLMQEYSYRDISMMVFGEYNDIYQHLISNIANKHCWNYVLIDYDFPTYRTHKQKLSDQKLDEIYKYHLENPDVDITNLARLFVNNYDNLDRNQKVTYRLAIKNLIEHKAFDHVYSKYYV